MTITAEVADVFRDAKAVHASALERLLANDIRDAAEKAWCATKRATDALILALTGELPEKSPITSQELNKLAKDSPAVDRLSSRYYTRQGSLHGECFYLGICDPIEVTERRIRETSDYIVEAERLAGGTYHDH